MNTELTSTQKRDGKTISERYNSEGWAAAIEGATLISQDSVDRPVSLLGSGRHWQVSALTHDDKEYVIKLPQEFSKNAAKQIEDSVNASLVTSDLIHFEVAHVASISSEVLVCERAAGTPLPDCGVGTLERVTEAQIREFLDEVITALDRGVVFDPSPYNLMYDIEAGFTAIDLSLIENNVRPEDAAAHLLNTTGVDFESLVEWQSLPSTEACTAAIALLEKVEAVASEMPQVYPRFLRTIRHDIQANREVIKKNSRKKAGFLKSLIKR